MKNYTLQQHAYDINAKCYLFISGKIGEQFNASKIAGIEPHFPDLLIFDFPSAKRERLPIQLIHQSVTHCKVQVRGILLLLAEFPITSTEKVKCFRKVEMVKCT